VCLTPTTNAMATVNQKIFRTANAPAGAPSEAETTVCQALIDLESHIPELKMELRPLQVSAVKEVDVKGGKKAYVIFVPMPQLKAFHKIQLRYVQLRCPYCRCLFWFMFFLQLTPNRLTRELEKKFSDHHVVFIGQRRILSKPSSHSRAKQPRPRSRTLTWVHNAILEDLVFPTEITAKSLRVSTDGSKLVRCSLDSKDATSLEYKLETFSSVYRKLTGKDVAFMI